MIIEKLHISHCQLIEAESIPPIALNDSIYYVPFGSFATLKLVVNFPKLVYRLSSRIQILLFILVVLFKHVWRRQWQVPIIKPVKNER